MVRPPKPIAPEVSDPSFDRPGDATSRHDSMWLIAQQMHELTSDFSKVSAKTDRLIADVGDLNKELKEIRHSFTLAKGVALCAFILIPACAVIVWWLIGGKLNELRDQMYQIRPSQSVVVPSPIMAPPNPTVPPATKP